MPTPPLSDEKAIEAVQTLEEYGGNKSHAAKSLGLDRRTFVHRLRVAARRGLCPTEDRVGMAPEGYVVKGKSTLYGDDGSIRAQWVKTTRDLEAQKVAMEAAIEAAKESIPREKPQSGPRAADDDLAACYVITDHHLGMLAWSEETGGDWDTDIAEDMLVRWFEKSIHAASDAHTGIFAQLGDLLHYDGLESVTPTSGNNLDADTRFQKVVRVAIRAQRRIISMMLDKHEHVRVIMAEGNHDIASSVWLREVFAALYENEPRVTVETSPAPYYCVEWGDTSIFFHHGHKAKVSELSRVMAGEFRDVFGRTKYSYAHCGHLHHVHAKEDSLMIVEQHPTLAARDAYSSRSGYASQRGASVIIYHKQYGEVGRSTIRPEMVT